MLKGLIVSCQSVKGEPFYGYNIMGLMASAASEGGADGIRTSGKDDIIAVKKSVDLPVIGLIKRNYEDSEIYITPTKFEIDELIDAAADYFAIDATDRTRPNGETLEQLVAYARQKAPDVKLLADISTLDEALNAEKLGFDYISTTLCGYTEKTNGMVIPNFKFVKQLKKLITKPLIVEGGIWEKNQLEKLIKLGVNCVVIGTAITRPREITSRFKEVFKN